MRLFSQLTRSWLVWSIGWDRGKVEEVIQMLSRAERVQTWRLYIESSVRIQNLLEAQLHQEESLSLMDYHVMVLLSEAPGGRLRMGGLAESLVFPPSSLTYRIASMKRRGLVTRENDPNDKRASQISLTESGKQTLERVAPHHAELVDGIFLSHATDEELKLLHQFLNKVCPALRDLTEAGADPSQPSPRPVSSGGSCSPHPPRLL